MVRRRPSHLRTHPPRDRGIPVPVSAGSNSLTCPALVRYSAFCCLKGNPNLYAGSSKLIMLKFPSEKYDWIRLTLSNPLSSKSLFEKKEAKYRIYHARPNYSHFQRDAFAT